ncbi:hypothetical protein E4U55_004042 [Claviceps digitariae]|nr:hypothetical protein E4U55_004042 [Claviceps digitariae]
MLLRRPHPLRTASALTLTLAVPTRLLSSSPSSLRPDPNPKSPSWPLLQRRSRPERTLSPEGPPDEAASSPGLHVSTPDGDMAAARPPPSDEAGRAEGRRDPRVMLILKGLSPRLTASDFHRLAPSDLSSWQSAIKKVQQQRDAVTLEPLGQYHLSFSTAQAAISYRDRLLRLHKLSQHRLDHVHGLWESLVPLHLHSAAGDDPAAEMQHFTISSGMPRRAAVDVQRRRISVTHTWTRDLAQLTGPDKPPVVLVRVYPPVITEGELGRWIREDGVSRGCAWEVCPPRELRLPGAKENNNNNNNNNDNDNDNDNDDISNNDNNNTSQGRFVVVCASDIEARRFHRHWNQRVVLPAGPANTTATTKSVIHVSIIDW